MKSISFRDLQLCTKFKGMNEIEMLALSNDSNMAWALQQVGFDTEYAVTYEPANHRCMQGKVAVGFRAVGEINMNKSYIDSKLCTPTERMIASAYIDPSLTQELSGLMGMRVNFRRLMDNGAESCDEDLPDDNLEPDYKFVEKQIKDLEDIRDEIRGEMYNESGEAKTYEEYKAWAWVDKILTNKKTKKIKE